MPSIGVPWHHRREQDFFEEKGWGGAARVRCHECSKAKKTGYAERAEAGERAGLGGRDTDECGEG